MVAYWPTRACPPDPLMQLKQEQHYSGKLETNNHSYVLASVSYWQVLLSSIGTLWSGQFQVPPAGADGYTTDELVDSI